MKTVTRLAMCMLAIFMIGSTQAKEKKEKGDKGGSKTVTTTIKVEDDTIKFSDADGNEVSIKTDGISDEAKKAAKDAAEGGTEVEVVYSAGKKGATLVKINGVAAAGDKKGGDKKKKKKGEEE